MKSKSGIFTLVGIFCLLILSFLLWERNSPRRLAFKTAEFNTNSSNTNSSYPKVLVIKDLGIELPIYSAKIENNKWQATTKGVSFLTNSALPGEKGNSILYGHNYPNLLGKLTKAKPGQRVDILFEKGIMKTFVIEFTQVLSPDQTYVLNSTEDNRVTLYTCTGFLDSKRFVVTALLKYAPV